jgi:uncharacterized membrane protein YtjA (UPF0391 family)
MLHLVITLLIIAIIAGLLGFGGIAGTAVGLAKVIFVAALVLFIVCLFLADCAAVLGAGCSGCLALVELNYADISVRG